MAGGWCCFPTAGRTVFRLPSSGFCAVAPCIPNGVLSGKVPRDLFVELQHFDLAGPVVPDIGYLDDIDPIVMLWDTHDLKTVKTHGLVFEARAAKGRLLVSALRHTGGDNAVGRWLLQVFVDQLNSPVGPKNALSLLCGLISRMAASAQQR